MRCFKKMRFLQFLRSPSIIWLIFMLGMLNGEVSHTDVPLLLFGPNMNLSPPVEKLASARYLNMTLLAWT